MLFFDFLGHRTERLMDWAGDIILQQSHDMESPHQDESGKVFLYEYGKWNIHSH